MIDLPLTAADLAEIADARATGFAIRQAVGTNVDLVLSRRDEATGAVVALPAQRVQLTYANRQQEAGGGEAAVVSYSAGTFAKLAPFDVEVGDRFRLPNGDGGAIAAVPMPQGGVQRAEFRLETGVA